MILFKDVRDFRTEQIFECGQAFRWNREKDGGYTGIAGGRAAKVAFVPSAEDALAGDLTIRPLADIRNATAATEREAERTLDGERGFWKDYFDLGRDYGAIKRVLAEGDGVMARAVAYGAGIRILNQDPWETLVSFIISQNNHIPRIKACTERLCEGFGERMERAGGGAFFGFPDIDALAALSAADLSSCGLGYRAAYIVKTARRVAAEGGAAWLDGLRDMPLGQAEKSLRSLCGVGPKVAACVLLFGLGMPEGFPVDVWMARAMRELYGVDAKGAAAYAASRFGPYAGIAQQYLFYYVKNTRDKGTAQWTNTY
jgi:N-glycosylase/DNA lyase